MFSVITPPAWPVSTGWPGVSARNSKTGPSRHRFDGAKRQPVREEGQLAATPQAADVLEEDRLAAVVAIERAHRGLAATAGLRPDQQAVLHRAHTLGVAGDVLGLHLLGL